MARKKPGAVSFYLGIGMVAVALVSSIAFSLFIGGPLVVGALALVVRGLTATGPKAVGQRCADCDRTIVIEHQAEFCERCSKAVHATCAASHVATAHKVETGSPFR